MAKKASDDGRDLPIAKVGDVPEHLLALVGADKKDTSLETMQHHRVLNRVGIVQGQAKREKKEKYGEGSIVIPATELKLATRDGFIDVVPVMFFDEFIKWADRDDASGKMILERSIDRGSPLAIKCGDPEKWKEKYGDLARKPAPFQATNTHHLNFLCVIYGEHEQKGMLVAISFVRAEFKRGMSWIGMIKQRKIAGFQAPLYTGVWRLKPGFRENEKGEWWGFDIEAAPGSWITREDTEQMKALHEQLKSDHKEQLLHVGHEAAMDVTGETQPAGSSGGSEPPKDSEFGG